MNILIIGSSDHFLQNSREILEKKGHRTCCHFLPEPYSVLYFTDRLKEKIEKVEVIISDRGHLWDSHSLNLLGQIRIVKPNIPIICMDIDNKALNKLAERLGFFIIKDHQIKKFDYEMALSAYSFNKKVKEKPKDVYKELKKENELMRKILDDYCERGNKFY